MGYHPGIGGLSEAALPHIYCNECGAIKTVYKRFGWYEPAKWFVDGKAAPKWKLLRDADSKRLDYCPKHKGGK